ncbi:hypothetical protein CPB86DRAFT_147741 [Serendipita vermifera]|nr:hypothetical protein CPB86DRAFT_147741 [Serendipita vermifera]
MRGLILKDTVVELATQEDCFLTGITHLTLEITQNGQVVDKANLLLRESTQGIWDADKIIALRDVAATFMVSVYLQFDENDRQLLGSVQLSGQQLLDTSGGQHEIPLMRHEDCPDLILRTRGSAMENVQESMRNIGQENAQ